MPPFLGNEIGIPFSGAKVQSDLMINQRFSPVEAQSATFVTNKVENQADTR